MLTHKNFFEYLTRWTNVRARKDMKWVVLGLNTGSVERTRWQEKRRRIIFVRVQREVRDEYFRKN